MSRKRTAEDVRQAQSAMPAEPSKRSRRSPLCSSDSSVASSARMSEDSASRNSPTIRGDFTPGSSMSSVLSAEGPEELEGSSSSEESSLLESDEDDDDVDDDQDEEEVVTIGGPKKPRIVQECVLGGAPDLRARISALLPQLAAANQELQSQGPGASMEEVQEGEQHIEMDLGLGVLEEKYGSDSSRDEGEDDCDDEEERGSDVTGMLPQHARRSRVDKELDTGVLDKLMGKEGGTLSKPGIQELG